MNSSINPKGYSNGNDSDVDSNTHKHTTDAGTQSYYKRQRHAKESESSLNPDGTPASTSPRLKSKGRAKPLLDEEARNKRAAQNRAAQRAFRERKERKMRELQDKVNQLQKVQQQNEVESEFLRGQLAILVGELKKYRPETANDSKVLSYLSHYDMSLGTNGSNAAFSFTYPQNKKQQQQQRQQRQQQQRDTGSNSSYLSSVRTPDMFSGQEGGLQTITPLTDTFSGARANSIISDNLTPNIASRGSVGASISNTVTSTPPAVKREDNSAAPTVNLSLKNPSSLFDGDSKLNMRFDAPSATWFDNLLSSDDFLSQQQLLANLTDLPNTKDNSSDTTVPTGNGASRCNPSAVDRLDSYDDSNLFSSNFNFNDRFDEQVSDFCVKMNQACGTRHDPIPKSKNPLASAVTPQSTDTNENANTSNNASLTSSNENSIAGTPVFVDLNFTNGYGQMTPVINDKNLSLGGVPFMNPSLAFPGDNIPGIPTGSSVTTDGSDNNLFMDQFLNAKRYNNTQYNYYDSDEDDTPLKGNSEKMDGGLKKGVFSVLGDEDPLSALVREEPSAYTSAALKEESDDNLGLEHHHSNNTSLTDMDDDDDDNDVAVVPDKGDTLLRCSEIWDRITTHPKYSDLDIDGLCSELMSKAKCSERGVVVNANDVQVALNKHLI